MSSGAEVPIQFEGGDQLGELGRFLQQLHGSRAMQEQWRNNRNAAIEDSGLSPGMQAFLKSNPDPSEVRARLEAEAGPGNKVWICVWIR